MGKIMGKMHLVPRMDKSTWHRSFIAQSCWPVLFMLMLIIASYRLPAQTLQTVFSFNHTNGAIPCYGLALGKDGNLYGSTYAGGDFDLGTIFRISPSGDFTTLVSFDGTNGDNPTGVLALGGDGNFYGTTAEGGTNGTAQGGYGTVFRLTSKGQLTTLFSFNLTNGQKPEAGLTLGKDGNLYGTTFLGGYTNYHYSAGAGTIFRITTNGVLTTLVYFDGTNGFAPNSALTMDADGNFYGSSESGYGTEFQMTPAGTLNTLYRFQNLDDGNTPDGALTLGIEGNLYGTCSGGAGGSYGTIFKLTTNGLTTLVSFDGTNGDYPVSTLAWGAQGKLYGTTYYDHMGGYGTVFSVTTNGVLNTQAYFNGANGANPSGVLTLAPDGNFYGTTRYGGAYTNDLEYHGF
jgi:uncharacterized repeat protein (TIGR03803 family)